MTGITILTKIHGMRNAYLYTSSVPVFMPEAFFVMIYSSLIWLRKYLITVIENKGNTTTRKASAQTHL